MQAKETDFNLLKVKTVSQGCILFLGHGSISPKPRAGARLASGRVELRTGTLSHPQGFLLSLLSLIFPLVSFTLYTNLVASESPGGLVEVQIAELPSRVSKSLEGA